MKKLAVLGLVLMMFCSVAFADTAPIVINADHYKLDLEWDGSTTGQLVDVQVVGQDAIQRFQTGGDEIMGALRIKFDKVPDGPVVSTDNYKMLVNAKVIDTMDDENDAYIIAQTQTDFGTIGNFMYVNDGNGSIATGNEFKFNEQTDINSSLSNVLDYTGQEKRKKLGQGQVYAGDQNFKAEGKFQFGKVVTSGANCLSKVEAVSFTSDSKGELKMGNSFIDQRTDVDWGMAFMRSDYQNQFEGTGYVQLTSQGSYSVWINGEHGYAKPGEIGQYKVTKEFTSLQGITLDSFLVDSRK